MVGVSWLVVDAECERPKLSGIPVEDIIVCFSIRFFPTHQSAWL